MGDERNYDKKLERIMDRLADSVMRLSKEEIFAEVLEAGYDPEETAERTRSLLRGASDALEIANTSIWKLGHTVKPNLWYRKDATFHNNCVSCGSLISFTPSTYSLGGLAAKNRCVKRDQSVADKRAASGM